MSGPFDAELVLRAISAGAETSTSAETGLALAVRQAGDFKAIVHVTALTLTGSPTPTYRISIETDSLAAFSDDPEEVGAVSVTATGEYEIPLSGKAIEKLDPNAAAIRCKATIAGAPSPSITYGCYLVPSRR